jgi:hypothetical protein
MAKGLNKNTAKQVAFNEDENLAAKFGHWRKKSWTLVGNGWMKLGQRAACLGEEVGLRQGSNSGSLTTVWW